MNVIGHVIKEPGSVIKELGSVLTRFLTHHRICDKDPERYDDYVRRAILKADRVLTRHQAGIDASNGLMDGPPFSWCPENDSLIDRRAISEKMLSPRQLQQLKILQKGKTLRR